MNAIDELTQALDAAVDAGRTVDIFFRDDDADEDLPNLRTLLEMFLRRAAPINLAVIPGTLTRRGARLLNEYRQNSPSLIELNQHGWMHTNHETTGRKCEFGHSRSYEHQFQNIQRGRDVLAEAFAAECKPLFVPPWNRCNDDTIRALHNLGFHAISTDGSEQASNGHHLRDIPVTFDIYTWKNGGTLKPEADIAKGLAAQVRAGHLIGILLHHKVMTTEAFYVVSIVLHHLTQSPAVRIHTFENVIASQYCGRSRQCIA